LYDENCVILSSTVFDCSTRVTDRRTDRRAIAYSALSMLSRAKNEIGNYIKYLFLEHVRNSCHLDELYFAFVRTMFKYRLMQ